MPSLKHEIQTRDIDVLNALHALPDACPVWKPYVCMTLKASYAGWLRLDFSLRALPFHGRTRRYWTLVKTVRLERRAVASDEPTLPTVKFR